MSKNKRNQEEKNGHGKMYRLGELTKGKAHALKMLCMGTLAIANEGLKWMGFRVVDMVCGHVHGLRNGMDLSPLLFVLEITKAQRVILHVVNCSERKIAICASSLSVNTFALQYFDPRRKIAVHAVQLNLSGQSAVLKKFRNLEQFDHLEFEATHFLNAGHLREGAMVVRVQFTMDGKTEREVASVSCPNLESVAP